MSYFGPPERFRYQEFPWFIAPNVDKAIEHLEYGAPALHMKNAFRDQTDLKKLLAKLKEKNCVKALFIPDCNLKDNGCEILKDFLMEDRVLKYLFIEENQVTDIGANHIIEALKHNKTLKTIMMGANKMTNATCKAMGILLRDFHNLREFSVGQDIDDTGAMYLAKGINFNLSLRAFYLLNNNITAKGARILAQVISRHPSCSNCEVVGKITLEEFTKMIQNMADKEMTAAFNAAVRNNEKGPWLRSKILVIGQGRAGKTATVRSLLGMKFKPDLESTIGAALTQSQTNGSNNSWNETKDIKVDFAKDTAARIAALKMAQRRKEEAKIYENFDFDEFVAQMEREPEDLSDIYLSKDAKEGKIDAVMSNDEINKKLDFKLVTNKSAMLEDINFTIWDMGGQEVFYTLHHLFLTPYGIYLLAFDMRDVIALEARNIYNTELAEIEKIKSAKQREEKKKEASDKFNAELKKKRAATADYLNFWLNSVKMHAETAPLILIGTFLDVVNSEEDIGAVAEFIDGLKKNKFSSVVPNGKLPFFPIDNTHADLDQPYGVTINGGKQGHGIDIVRDTIEDVARHEEFVNRKLPLRWMKALDEILAKEDSYLTLTKVRKICAEIHLNDENEVDKMLEYFHDLGMLIHLRSTQNLREIVTTKPQWLIDSLSKVIRDKSLHRFDENEVSKAGLMTDMELIMKKCVATRDWLEYLWPKEQVDFLIDLMKSTMLISEWKFGKRNDSEAFLVPSLVTQKNDRHAEEANCYLETFNDKKFYLNDDARAIVFDFTRSFLPNGVFQRLLSLCLSYTAADSTMKRNVKRLEPVLFKESAVIYMGGENDQTFHLYKKDLQILCVVKNDFIRAYKMLLSMMRKLRQDVMGSSLEWDEYLDIIPSSSEVKDGSKMMNDDGILHQFIHYDEASKRKLPPWFEKEDNLQDTVSPEENVELNDFITQLDLF